MAIEKVPEIYYAGNGALPEVFAYDFKMTSDVVKSKVHLSMNMFSFLQVGKKQVHFADTSVAVHNKQSLLLKKGNWLWTELLDTDEIYYCKLFFFSEQKLVAFMQKHAIDVQPTQKDVPYFIIENDAYIASFLASLSQLQPIGSFYKTPLLALKLEEVLLYLLLKYGADFQLYL